MPPSIAHHGQVSAAIAKYAGVGKSGDRPARLTDHFPADVHGVDLTEVSGDTAGNTSGPAADLEYSHLFGILALADVAQVVENLLFERRHTGAVELFIRPLLLSGDDIVASVFPRAALPIPPHSQQLSCGLKYGH